jgi:hypothetical protein
MTGCAPFSPIDCAEDIVSLGQLGLAPSAIFPQPTLAIDQLRQRAGCAGGLIASLAQLSDTALWEALRAAEADAEIALRVFFSPVEILPESATEAERQALDDAGTRWIEEPGYDLESEFFMGDRWGYLATRHRPLIAVTRMQFVDPRPASGIFEIPKDWLRLDKKYGHIRLVPSTQAYAAPLTIGILQALGGGRDIPQAIQLRYKLMPYNYHLAFENNQTGMPLMRPLFFAEAENEVIQLLTQLRREEAEQTLLAQVNEAIRSQGVARTTADFSAS